MSSIAPILRREFIAILRSRQAFWIALGAVALASLVPLAAWPWSNEQAVSSHARRAFSTYGWTCSIVFLVAVPLVTASSVTTERERGTWELLYNTHIGPAALVAGKLLAAIGFFVGTLVLTFPMACLVFLLGGSEWRRFSVVFAFLVAEIVFCAIVGLGASMRSARTTAAVFHAFVLIAVTLLASVLLGSLVTVAPGVSPLELYLEILILILAPSATISLWRSLAHARVPGAPGVRRVASSAQGTVEPRARAREGWPARWFLRKSEFGVPDSWNPVVLATLRNGVLSGSARTALRVLFLVGLVFYLLVLVGIVAPDPTAMIVGADVLYTAVIFVTPGLAATSLTSEVELDRFDFLRASALLPAEVVMGKLYATFAALGGYMLAVVAALVISVLSTEPEPLVLLLVAGMSSASFIVCASSGVLAASLTRRTVPALLLAYAIAFCSVVVLFPFAFLLIFTLPIAVMLQLGIATNFLQRRWRGRRS